MADVYLAMLAGPAGSGFSKLAVVKRLRPNLADDPDFVAMLMDEARISARLNHTNVVQTHEVGVEGDSYYLAMEYLDGQPLHRIQRRSNAGGRRLETDYELLIASDVLAGLHHAHELQDYDGTPLQIVHRDVTPSNVFVTYGGYVKVVDFGIAKAAGRACETRQGVVKGKIRHMAPEQAMGLAIDRRADIFAVGILIWEALVGRRFWGDADDIGIARKLIAGDYEPSPRAADPSVPAELDAIVRKAMAHAPHERYATAEELRLALDGYLSKLDTIALRKRIGGRVAELFAKERLLLREIIDRAGRATAPVSVETLASSFYGGVSRTQPPPASTGSMRPAVLDAGPSELPTIVPPPSPAPMIIPPVSPVRHSGGILPYAVAAGALVAVVYSLLTAVTESAPVAAYPPRTKVAAAHVIAPHSQAARIEKQLVDVHVEAPQPVVVTRIRVPLPRAHAKPPPAVSSVAAAAPPSSAPETPTRAADTKIPDLHVTDRVRKQPDTTDPWSGGGPPDKSAIDGW